MKLTATTTQYKAFGQMTDDEKTELVVGYYVKGMDIEYRGIMGNWYSCMHRTLDAGYYYRLADQPQPKQGATIEFTHDELVALDYELGEVIGVGATSHIYNAINDHLAGEMQ